MIEQTSEIPPEQMQQEVISVAPKKNSLPVILLVILGLLVAAGLVYAGITIGKKQTQPNVVAEPTVAPQATEVSPTPDETANWKTYKNEKYGFEFKYPEKLQSEENIYSGEKGIVYCLNFNKFISFNFNLVRGVYAGAAGCSFSDFGIGGVSTDFEAGRSGGFTDTQGYEKDNGKIVFKFVGTKKFEIPQDLVKKVYTNENGVEIVVVEGKTQTDSPFQVMGTPGDGNLGALINTKNSSLTGLAVVYSKTSKLLSENEFYQILSTFKFTNQTTTTDSTANWKTYKNTKFNFSFMYPSELTYIHDQSDQYSENGISNAMILIQNFDGSKPRSEKTDDFQIVVYIANKSGQFNLEDPKGEQTKTTINGVEAIKSFTTQKWVSVPTVIFQSSPNKVAVQLSNPQSTNKAWFDQILSTFKFTN